MGNTELATVDNLAVQMQSIIDDCLPAITGKGDIMASLKLGAGVVQIRELLDTPEIKKMVEALKDSPLGFITDRSAAAMEAAKKDRYKKDLLPYTWEQIRECVAEGLLRGYRITGNEMNIISGRFYAAKDGKYRRIIEWPGVSGFEFGNSSPLYMVEKRVGYNKQVQDVQVAEIEVFASWKQDGTARTFGRIPGLQNTDQDRQTFRIRAHGGDDDATVGKALSKLFSRVLMRISGQIMPECTDLDTDTSGGMIIDLKADQSADKSKEFDDKVKAANLDVDMMSEFVSLAGAQNHLNADDVKIEAMKDIDGFVDQFKKWAENFKESEEDIKPPDGDQGGTMKEPPPDDSGIWDAFVRKWEKLAPKNFRAFFDSQKDKFAAAPDHIKEKARAKWTRQIDEPIPLEIKKQEKGENINSEGSRTAESGTGGGSQTSMFKNGVVESEADLEELMKTDQYKEMMDIKKKYPEEFAEVVPVDEIPNSLDRVKEIIDLVSKHLIKKYDGG